MSRIPADFLRCYPAQFYVTLFLTLSLFSLPLSSSAKSIFLSLSVISILMMPSNRRALCQALSQPWCQSALLLFFVVFVGMAWSPATLKDKFYVLEKYSKLLYLPILAIAFQEKQTRRYALYGFLLAMVITCIAAILKDYGLIAMQLRGLDSSHLFRNHIMTGYMMALAAYLSATLFINESGHKKTIHAILFLFFSYQILFINIGRTGYVCYLALMGLFFVQMLTWRQIVLACVIGSTVLAGVYHQNETMQNRVNQVYIDWKEYQQGDKDTSLGYRLQFHQYSKALFDRHPWIGNGTGSFSYLYRSEQPIPSWGAELSEPHSQYWLTLAELGMLGFIALSLFFISLMIASWRLKTMRSVAFAVILPFLLVNFSDSLLFYSGTGYLFIVFMALCLGENVTRPDPAVQRGFFMHQKASFNNSQ